MDNGAEAGKETKENVQVVTCIHLSISLVPASCSFMLKTSFHREVAQMQKVQGDISWQK